VGVAPDSTQRAGTIPIERGLSQSVLVCIIVWWPCDYHWPRFT
jgi:hypothetical protein